MARTREDRPSASEASLRRSSFIRTLDPDDTDAVRFLRSDSCRKFPGTLEWYSYHGVVFIVQLYKTGGISVYAEMGTHANDMRTTAADLKTVETWATSRRAPGAR